MVNIVRPVQSILAYSTAYAGYDGSEFSLFLDQVKARYPHLKAYRSRVTEAWLAFGDEDLFAVAKLTYEDSRIRVPPKTWGDTTDHRTFNLFSRTIENFKIKRDKEEHHLKKSKSDAVILDAIGRYTKPLTTHELVLLTSSEVSTPIYEFYGPVVRQRDALRRTVGVISGSPAERYLMQVARNNKEDLSAELADVTRFVSMCDELEALDLHKREVKAVHIDGDTVRVVDVPTRHRYDGVPDLHPVGVRSDEMHYAIYSVKDVPDIIRDRVNALNILGRLEFVPNVGIKHSDKVFYVVI